MHAPLQRVIDELDAFARNNPSCFASIPPDKKFGARIVAKIGVDGSSETRYVSISEPGWEGAVYVPADGGSECLILRTVVVRKNQPAVAQPEIRALLRRLDSDRISLLSLDVFDGRLVDWYPNILCMLANNHIRPNPKKRPAWSWTHGDQFALRRFKRQDSYFVLEETFTCMVEVPPRSQSTATGSRAR